MGATLRDFLCDLFALWGWSDEAAWNRRFLRIALGRRPESLLVLAGLLAFLVALFQQTVQALLLRFLPPGGIFSSQIFLVLLLLGLPIAPFLVWATLLRTFTRTPVAELRERLQMRDDPAEILRRLSVSLLLLVAAAMLLGQRLLVLGSLLARADWSIPGQVLACFAGLLGHMSHLAIAGDPRGILVLEAPADVFAVVLTDLVDTVLYILGFGAMLLLLSAASLPRLSGPCRAALVAAFILTPILLSGLGSLLAGLLIALLAAVESTGRLQAMALSVATMVFHGAHLPLFLAAWWVHRWLYRWAVGTEEG